MYELICPYCRNVVSTSFVRKGAIATCPQCSRQYLIKAETYRRTVTTAKLVTRGGRRAAVGYGGGRLSTKGKRRRGRPRVDPAAKAGQLRHRGARPIAGNGA